MLILPIDQQSAWFEFSCELESVMFTFTFRFNDRDGCWYFDIADAQGNALASGLKAVTEYPLLSAVRKLPGLPIGQLMIDDTAGLSQEPSFDSLGRRHRMIYFTLEDLAEIGL